MIMNGFKKLIGFMVTAALTAGCLPLAAAQTEGIYLNENFDTLELENDGTAAGETTFGDFYLNWAEKQPFSAAVISQPEKKFEGSSLSTPDASADTALKLTIQDGSSANSYFRTSLNKSENMYEKKKLRFAFNINIQNANSDSYAPVQVDFRSGAMVKNLIGFRGNKSIQIFDNTNGVNLDQKWTAGAWNYVVFDFDTEAKTYDLYLNGAEQKKGFVFAGGELAFPGEFTDDVAAGEAGKFIIDQIRFSVNNGKNCTGANVLIDDIYFGKVPEEPEPDFAASELTLTDGTEELAECSVQAGEIYAETAIDYPKNTQNQQVSLIGALYEKNVLKKVWIEKEDFSNRTESGSQTMKLAMNDMELNADCWIKAYVWNGTKPMTEAKAIPVTDDAYLYYQNYAYLNEGDAMPQTSVVNGIITAAVGSDLEGSVKGLLGKILIPKTGTSSYPFLNYNTGNVSEPFVVEYDMRTADDKTTCVRKVGFRDENSGSTVMLLNYRPTGSLQNGASQEIGKYTNWQWTHYKLEVDPEEGTYTCYINDSLAGSGSFSAGARLNALRFTFENSNGSDDQPCATYIDNMKICKAE